MAIPTWKRIDPLVINNERTRVVVQELWRTDELTVDNPLGEELIDSVPVQFDQPHSDPRWASRGCKCVSKRLVYGPLRRIAKVLVTYDSDSRFGFGYSPKTNRSNKSLQYDLVLPILQQTVSGSDLRYDLVERVVGIRPAMRRTFTQDITGQTDLIAAAIVPNIGHRYFLRLRNGAAGPPASVDDSFPLPDGIQIILFDFSVTDLGNSYNRVVYEFRWMGPVPAIRGTDVGSLVDYPALGELDEYNFPFSDPASALLNGVGVIDGLKLYPPGLTLP